MAASNSLLRKRTLAQVYWNYAIRRRAVVRYLPYRLWVEPTSRCNLACTHCPNKDLPKESLGMMEWDLFTKVIDEAATFAHDINVHHRGESLIHPRIYDMIRHARSRGLYVKLHTNATFLSREKARWLIDAGLSLISFSFDGYEKATYERYRVGSDFEKTLANIVGFLEAKKEAGTRAPYAVFEVIDFEGTIGGSSSGASQAFRKLFDGLPLDRLIVKPPHNWAGNVEIAGNGGPPLGCYSPCTFPWHSLVVCWDGTVTPCPQDFLAEIVLGDARRQTLREIFHGEPMRRLREMMLARALDPALPCVRCDMIRRPRLFGVPRDSLRFLEA